MKKFILLGSLIVLSGFSLYGPQAPIGAPQDPFGAPPSEEEINQFLNSDEFEKLFGPMNPDEKKALAEATMQETKKLEQMSPQERQELERQAEEFLQSQLERQQEQPLPVPQEPQPAPTVPMPKPTPTPKTGPTPVAVNSSKLAGIRDLVENTGELIEDIDLQFESLPRVSSDNVLENKWAQIKPDIPFTVATLKAVGKKDQLLEKLISSEYRLLKDQLSGLRSELARNHRNLITSDSSMLSKLSDTDAARAQPLTKQEKKQSKRARNRIIEILHQEIPNISFGIKGLLEKYAPEVLKESKVKMPQTKPSRVTSSGGRSGYGGYSGDGGYGSGNYGGYGSGYSPSSSGYGTSDGDRYSRPGRDLSRFDNKLPARSMTKNEEDDDKKDKKAEEKGADDTLKKADKKDAQKAKSESSSKEYTEKVIKELDKLDKKIKAEIFERKKTDDSEKKSAEKKTIVKDTIDKLNATEEPKREDLQEARRSLQEVNQSLLVGVNKEFTKMLRDIESKAVEIKNEATQDVLTHLHKKKNIKTLMKTARKAAEMSVSTTASDELKQVRKLLADFLDGHQTMTIQLSRQDFEPIKQTIAKLDADVKAALLDETVARQALDNLGVATAVIDTGVLGTINSNIQQITPALEKAKTDRNAAIKELKKKQQKHQRDAFAIFISRAPALTQLYNLAKTLSATIPAERKVLADSLKKYAEQYKTLITVK